MVQTHLLKMQKPQNEDEIEDLFQNQIPRALNERERTKSNRRGNGRIRPVPQWMAEKMFAQVSRAQGE